MINNLSVLHVLPLQQSLRSPKVLSCEDTLSFNQTINFSFPNLVKKVTSRLILSDHAKSSIIPLSVSSHLSLLHAPKIGLSLSFSLSDILSFGSHSYRSITLNVSNSLTLSQDLPHGTKHTLNLVQTILVNKTKPVFNHLNLVQLVKEKVVRLLALNNQLNLVSAGFGFVPTVKYIGISIPKTVHRNTIELISNDYKTKLILRTPQFGNSDKIEHARVSKQSRGGNLIIRRESYWPKTETFNYKITALRQIDVKNLLQFIQDSLGEEITLIDYESQVWQGVIINPDSEAIQTGIDFFEMGFEFQVTNPIQNIQSNINLNEMVSHA